MVNEWAKGWFITSESQLPHHHFTIWMIVWGADRYGGTSASVTVCNQINLWGIGNAVQVEKHDQDKIYSNIIVIIMSYLCQYSIQISVRLYYGWYFLPPFLTRCQLTPTETVLNSDVFQFLSWWYGHVSKWETPQKKMVAMSSDTREFATKAVWDSAWPGWPGRPSMWQLIWHHPVMSKPVMFQMSGS